MKDQDRRTFLENIGAATGAVVLAPVLNACNRQADGEVTTPPTSDTTDAASVGETPADPDPMAIPQTRPDDWDPIAFNRDRGNAGAIPDSYLPDINGEAGVTDHLGKHLPYVPTLEDPSIVPEGYLPLMFGDTNLGYIRHPNASGEAEGEVRHWYDWLRVRKAVDGEAEEAESEFSGWPESGEGDTGRYAVFGDGEITDDGGRDTIYLVRLPSDIAPGDVVRIYGHCLSHGEYVDFLTLPTA